MMVETPRPVPLPVDGYDPSWFPTLFEIEDRHFWFRARNRVIATLTAGLAEMLQPGHRVLEIGCGTGNVLRVLSEAFPRGTVIGMDVFSEGLSYARRRLSCPLVQGDMRSPPFGGRFEVIGLFDTLEHLEDDLSALRDISQLLVPDGILLLSVPAHPWLWSDFDVASRHHRRYELSGLRARLRAAGFRTEYMTLYMACAYPLLLLQRKAAVLLGRYWQNDAGPVGTYASYDLRIRPIFNELMTFLLAQESWFIERRRSLPMGTSILAVVRKERTSI